MTGSCKCLLWCVLSLCVVSGAKAHEGHESNQSPQLEASVGAVCDLQAQAERLVRLAGENSDRPREALNQVNDEAGKQDACVVAPIHYLPGNKVARITNPLGTYEIVEILVVAVETARGTAALSQPVLWFAIFQAEDKDV